MRTRALLLCAVTALSLAACQKNAGGPEAPAPAADAAAPAAEADAAASPSTQRAEAPAPLPMPQLAYAYKYALTAPPQSVRKLISKHEAVCWAAGPQVCQVVGSDISEEGKDQLHATLTLRAQPAWLRTFRNGLDDDTKAVGGRTVTANTASEDLAADIVDTEAALRSKLILRDRLEQMLRTRQGKLADLMQAEQQLAAVRAEIDATRSQAAQMKGRVAASTLTINYRSTGVLAPSGVFAPVGEATGDVAATLAVMTALVIRLGTVVLPLAGLGWLGWRIVRLARRRRSPAA